MKSTKNQFLMKIKLRFSLLLFHAFLISTAATPPTISYNTPFCQSSTVETVTITGTTGGVFSTSPFSLSINSITGTIDPSASVPGTYAVTYTTPPGSDPAFATTTLVTILEQPNAGIDGGVTVCESETTIIDLHSLITGEQTGGTWVRVTGTGGTFSAAAGTFTPALGATNSSFIYTLLATFPCSNDTSIATVIVTPQPDAGLDGNLTASTTTDQAINLFSVITAFQPGGSWTRTSGSGGTFNASNGTFNPFPDATTSTFTYRISGMAPCVDDIAVATITTNALITPTFSLPSVVCEGSEATILPVVSNNGISGSWFPSNIDSTVSTIYVFTPNPDQGASVITLVISVVPAPIAIVTATDPAVIGSPYVVTFTGTPDATVTYNINSGPNQVIALNNNGLATAFYENAVSSVICLLSVSDTSCTALLNECVTVNVVDVPAPIGNPTQTFAPGATLADVVVTGTNIQWYDGANRNVNSNPLPLSTVLVNGATYYASQTSNGYESPDRLAVTVQLTLATNPFEFVSLTYSPNPVENILQLSSEDVFQKVSVYNYLGQAVFQQLFDTSNLKLDLGFLTKGNYFVKLESEGKQEVIKIHKN